MSRHLRKWECRCLCCEYTFVSARENTKFCSEQCSKNYARRKKAFKRILAGIRTVER